MSEIDVRGFSLVVQELARISGKDYFDVLIPQVGAVLKSCISLTPARTVGQIAKRVSARGSFIEFADGTKISVWKKAGGEEMFFDESTYPQYAAKWPKGSPIPKMADGKSWHNMSDHRFGGTRWASYQAHKKQRAALLKQWMEEGKAGRGLAKKSWWQIAEDLGLEPGLAAAYVRKAHAVKDNHDLGEFKEGFAAKLVERAAAIIEITNANPLVVGKLDGRRILEIALLNRERAFMTDLEKGVFQDVKRRAERYPGIFVN